MQVKNEQLKSFECVLQAASEVSDVQLSSQAPTDEGNHQDQFSSSPASTPSDASAKASLLAPPADRETISNLVQSCHHDGAPAKVNTAYLPINATPPAGFCRLEASLSCRRSAYMEVNAASDCMRASLPKQALVNCNIIACSLAWAGGFNRLR